MKLIQDETRPGLWPVPIASLGFLEVENPENPWEHGTNSYENPLENGDFSIKANFMDFPNFSITKNHRTCSDQQESRESNFNQCTLVKQ